MKDRNVDVEAYVPCECREVTHFLHMYYWRPDPVRQIVVSVGSHYGITPPLRERLSAAWKMLRGRRHFFNEVYVSEVDLMKALVDLGLVDGDGDTAFAAATGALNGYRRKLVVLRKDTETNDQQ